MESFKDKVMRELELSAMTGMGEAIDALCVEIADTLDKLTFPNQKEISRVLKTLSQINNDFFLRPVTKELTNYTELQNEDGWCSHLSRPDIHLDTRQDVIMVGGVLTIFDKHPDHAKVIPVEIPNLYLASELTYSGGRHYRVISGYPPNIINLSVNGESRNLNIPMFSAIDLSALVTSLLMIRGATRCYSYILDTSPKDNPPIFVMVSTDDVESVEACIDNWVESIKTHNLSEDQFVEPSTPEIDEAGVVSFPNRGEPLVGWELLWDPLPSSRGFQRGNTNILESRLLKGWGITPLNFTKPLEEQSGGALGYTLSSDSNNFFTNILPPPQHVESPMDIVKDKVQELGDGYDIASMFSMPADDGAGMYVGVIVKVKK